MKTCLKLFLLTICLTLCFSNSYAQDAPFYLTITQSHWDFDNEDGDNERWLELAKMWHDNVVMKNEHIIGSGVYYHHYTGDNSEVIFVSVYPSWEAIQKAGKRTGELAEAAWPDEDKRKALAKERNSYYTTEHSDEIYITQPYSKPLTSIPEEPLVYLVVDRHLAFPDDADDEEYDKLMTEFHTNVTHKNPHLLGFYIHRHAWGSDGRDLQFVFAVKDMAAIDDMQDAQDELIEAHWPDEDKRKEFFKALDKYFTPWHSDKIYQSEPELIKNSAPPAIDDKEAEKE